MNMKKILFLSNYVSPYRVQFYNELSRFADVTVICYNGKKQQAIREDSWFQEGNFRQIQLEKCVFSRGEDGQLCLDVISWLSRPFDAVVLCGYSSPTQMLAMAWLRLHRIPFYLEVDGGLVRKESELKYRYKKLLVSSPTWWISSGEHTTDYLCHYGAKRDRVFRYPFTSLWQKEIPEAVPGEEEKCRLRRQLGLPEEKIVLYAGRYDPKKGMDDLLHCVPRLDRSYGFCFVGGEPTAEHRRFCQEHDLRNVHFVGFQSKQGLHRYYCAADVLVLPTKSDVWGLVLNEAMACGLPVITTDQCVAGLELIRDGENGYIVPVDYNEALTQRIQDVLEGDFARMGAAALETIRPYTVENMVQAHRRIFDL